MNKKNKIKKNKGFSLVELIIVIAIMAILAGVLIPQFVRYISRAGVSADIEQAQNIYNSVAAAYSADQVDGTSNIALDTWTKVDGSVATILNMGSSAPESRVNGNAFWYNYNTSTGDVQVGVGASDTDAASNLLMPSVTGADWQ